MARGSSHMAPSRLRNFLCRQIPQADATRSQSELLGAVGWIQVLGINLPTEMRLGCCPSRWTFPFEILSATNPRLYFSNPNAINTITSDITLRGFSAPLSAFCPCTACNNVQNGATELSDCPVFSCISL